jgi:two-component sensor histidine kinase/CheY-like chemotaxis protein
LRILRPDGEARWCVVAAAATFDEKGAAQRVSGVTTDITERKEAENRQAMLAREVDHRAKNALAVVQAIVRLARRENIADYVAAIEGRIGALAQTHELLSKARWEGADILRLVLDELAPYRGEGQARITAVGPSVTVPPETAQAIGMMIHELATNAAKYGSLSSDDGRVDIGWSYSSGVLSLDWKESGGPPVDPPGRTGFGTKIISSVSGGDRGKVTFDWLPGGLHFSMRLACAVRSGDGEAPEAFVSADPVSPVAAGAQGDARILLVEDEMTVGIFMHELLRAVGYEATLPLARLQDAMAAAREKKFDCAVLDMNLNGEMVYPLADLLKGQQVPFLFLTGYAADSIDGRFGDVPVLQKPVAQEVLVRTLTAMMAARPAAPVQENMLRL